MATCSTPDSLVDARTHVLLDALGLHSGLHLVQQVRRLRALMLRASSFCKLGRRRSQHDGSGWTVLTLSGFVPARASGSVRVCALRTTIGQ
jgi:hypothetical protein